MRLLFVGIQIRLKTIAYTCYGKRKIVRLPKTWCDYFLDYANGASHQFPGKQCLINTIDVEYTHTHKAMHMKSQF